MTTAFAVGNTVTLNDDTSETKTQYIIAQINEDGTFKLDNEHPSVSSSNMTLVPTTTTSYGGRRRGRKTQCGGRRGRKTRRGRQTRVRRSRRGSRRY